MSRVPAVGRSDESLFDRLVTHQHIMSEEAEHTQ